jgi:hypothetical protein
MIKDKTITMSRELEILEEINAAANRQACFEVQRLTDELRSLLAAPVVERQPEPVLEALSRRLTEAQMTICDLKSASGKPVAIVTGSTVQWLPGAGSVKDRAELYTSQPAPVSVALPERRDLSKKMFDAMSPSERDISFKDIGWNACLDKVKEMNG